MSDTTQKMVADFRGEILSSHNNLKTVNFKKGEIYLDQVQNVQPHSNSRVGSISEIPIKEKPESKIDGFMVAVWILLFAPILLLISLELYYFLENALDFLP